jgi:hypothetical protein
MISITLGPPTSLFTRAHSQSQGPRLFNSCSGHLYPGLELVSAMRSSSVPAPALRATVLSHSQALAPQLRAPRASPDVPGHWLPSDRSLGALARRAGPWEPVCAGAPSAFAPSGPAGALRRHSLHKTKLQLPRAPQYTLFAQGFGFLLLVLKV